MESASPVKTSETRMVFRVLAGIIGAVLLLAGPPLALSGAIGDTWMSWVCSVACLYAGIGLAVGARTGRWYGIRA